ncbi:MAG: hypothetical protein HYY48_01635 [Gammaproteobacteria bacterium]|nr:hypothetical protein [Gammaproteobacteria bacterium]
MRRPVHSVPGPASNSRTSLQVKLRDRLRMRVIAGTFVPVSGAIYFAFCVRRVIGVENPGTAMIGVIMVAILVDFLELL